MSRPDPIPHTILTFREDDVTFLTKMKGVYIMPNSFEIGHLSKEDKLRVMEAIWEDLSREDEEVESPRWHKKALQETEQRLNSGEEEKFDWQTAKKELRERFECLDLRRDPKKIKQSLITRKTNR